MQVTLSDMAGRIKRFTGSLERRSAGFLKNQQPKLENLSKAVVKTTVYDVYEPQVYWRTWRMYESIRAHFPNPGDPFELWIDSDPDIAPAKRASFGYPVFVAGEGPGIGFLQTEYAGQPSGFPREFHIHIWRAVSAELPARFEDYVIDPAMLKV